MALTGDERLAWLREVPLFRGCAESSLAALAERTAEIDFRPGQAIVQQGQVGNGLFILVKGTARVTTGDQELAHLGPGEVIGELSVIDQEPRVATVTAVEAVRCLALASWDLLALLEEDAQLGLNLVHELVRRLRSCDEQLRH